MTEPVLPDEENENERTSIFRAYKGNYIYSIFSIFSFLTKGLLIFSGIHAGLILGALTISVLR